MSVFLQTGSSAGVAGVGSCSHWVRTRNDACRWGKSMSPPGSDFQSSSPAAILDADAEMRSGWKRMPPPGSSSRRQPSSLVVYRSCRRRDAEKQRCAEVASRLQSSVRVGRRRFGQPSGVQKQNRLSPPASDLQFALASVEFNNQQVCRSRDAQGLPPASDLQFARAGVHIGSYRVCRSRCAQRVEEDAASRL